MLLILLVAMLATDSMLAGVDVYNIDSIDRLYVKNTGLALERLAVLRSRCERSGWKECSRSHLESIESLAYMYCKNVRCAQRHALAAITYASDEGDTHWKMISFQTLCETFAEDRNWVLLGKYAQRMKQEAVKVSKPWYVALADIFAALAEGYFGKTDRAIVRIDKAVETFMATIATDDRYDQFDALILYYNALDVKIGLCMNAGKDSRAYSYIMAYLDCLDKDESNGTLGMDQAGFDIERMRLYARLANVCHRMGRDGDAWYAKATDLYQKYPDNTEVAIFLTDYLYSTRKYSAYEAMAAPLLSAFSKREANSEALHLTWQWIDILGKTGRTDSIATWTTWGLRASDQLIRNTYNNASESFKLAYDSETQKAIIEEQQTQLKYARLRLLSLGLLSALFAIFVAVFIVLWQKQKRDKRHLLGLIEESQKKDELTELLMKKETDENAAVDPDVKTLADLHSRLMADEAFRKSDNVIESVCQEMGLSQRKLNAVLQKTRGVTLSGYIRDLRLDYACRLLREQPRLKVEAVALESGYNTLRQFLRAFKDKYNVTPTEFRNFPES